MGLNNPIPRDVGKEARKAANILRSFVKPNQLISYDQVIPPHVLRRAKGLVILTVLKAGFLFSGRAGSGVIVARLPDGSWSPPSAIMTGGAGAGGQIGAEITDFIFVLNTSDAVKVFSKSGQLTLGGNISLAAGPLGRNAEAAGAATAGKATAIFSYAKTKGLFAGVSIEGSVLIERREANRKFYGSDCTAQMILSGRVRAPRSVEPLYQILESRAFSTNSDGDYNSSIYDDIPDFDADSIDGSYRRDSDRSGRGRGRDSDRGRDRYDDRYDDRDQDRRRERFNDYDDFDEGPLDVYDTSHRGSQSRFGRHADDEDEIYSSSRSRPSQRYVEEDDRRSRVRDYESSRYDDRPLRRSRSRSRSQSRSHSQQRYREPRSTNSYSAAAASAPPSSARGMQAVALYRFAGEQDGDLPFQKGDVITITAKSDSVDDWWTGEVAGRKGIFPANYVQLV